MVHIIFTSIIPDIDVDLRAREKQLWKPLLRVFHKNGPKAFDVLDKVVTEYVEEITITVYPKTVINYVP